MYFALSQALETVLLLLAYASYTDIDGNLGTRYGTLLLEEGGIEKNSLDPGRLFDHWIVDLTRVYQISGLLAASWQLCYQSLLSSDVCCSDVIPDSVFVVRQRQTTGLVSACHLNNHLC